jgi:hypothetical protein
VHVKSSDISARILCNWHTASHTKVEKVLIMETLLINKPNFVKDTPMIYVNLIVIVIIVPEKQKWEGIIFVPPLVHHPRPAKKFNTVSHTQ